MGLKSSLDGGFPGNFFHSPQGLKWTLIKADSTKLFCDAIGWSPVYRMLLLHQIHIFELIEF